MKLLRWIWPRAVEAESTRPELPARAVCVDEWNRYHLISEASCSGITPLESSVRVESDLTLEALLERVGVEMNLVTKAGSNFVKGDDADIRCLGTLCFDIWSSSQEPEASAFNRSEEVKPVIYEWTKSDSVLGAIPGLTVGSGGKTAEDTWVTSATDLEGASSAQIEVATPESVKAAASPHGTPCVPPFIAAPPDKHDAPDLPPAELEPSVGRSTAATASVVSPWDLAKQEDQHDATDLPPAELEPSVAIPTAASASLVSPWAAPAEQEDPSLGTASSARSRAPLTPHALYDEQALSSIIQDDPYEAMGIPVGRLTPEETAEMMRHKPEDLQKLRKQLARISAVNLHAWTWKKNVGGLGSREKFIELQGGTFRYMKNPNDPNPTYLKLADCGLFLLDNGFTLTEGGFAREHTFTLQTKAPPARKGYEGENKSAEWWVGRLKKIVEAAKVIKKIGPRVAGVGW